MYLCDVMSILRTNCVDNSFSDIVGVEVGLTVGSADGVVAAVSVGSTVVPGETVGSAVTCGVSVGAGDAFQAKAPIPLKTIDTARNIPKIFFILISPLNYYKIIISHRIIKVNKQ